MKNAIIIFTRVPLPGITKTRLMPFLSPEECCGLHKAFIRDIFKSCINANVDILVFFTPSDKEEDLKELFNAKASFIGQRGDSIGERMENAFIDAFKLNYEKVVLIGSDIPQISAEILNHAFEALKNNQVVVNPSEDGGYYLIGMKENHKNIWNIKEYGNNTVVENTIKNIKEDNLQVGIGETLRDVDEKEDLLKLWEDINNHSFDGCNNTKEFIEEKLIEKLKL